MKTAANQQDAHQPGLKQENERNQWFDVVGDLDDFIFFYEDSQKKHSEK